MPLFPKRLVWSALAASFCVALPAGAVPKLQLYAEGATYCEEDCPTSPGSTAEYEDSWTVDGSVGFRLWVMGQAPLYSVKLVASFNDVAGNSPTVDLYGTTLGAPAMEDGILANSAQAYAGFTDNLAPSSIAFESAVLNGALTGLQQNEGKYGAGRAWAVFELGDFAFAETRLGDAAPGSFAADGSAGVADGPANKRGQLNVYDVAFRGDPALDGQVVNFDVWACPVLVVGGRCGGRNDKWVNAPNSHDVQWRQVASLTLTDDDSGGALTMAAVSEPGSLALFFAGLLRLGIAARRRA